jgi:hypothetical protein
MKIPSQVTRLAARQTLLLRKHSPQILFVSGIVGVVTSAVLACKATLKVSDKLDEIQENVAHSKAVLVHHDQTEVATEIERAKNQKLATIYIRGSYDIAKLYTPAVFIGVVSIGALTGSHVVLTRRNVALTAAYSGLARAYDEYRERVRDEVGESKELDIYHGISLENVKGEDGKKELVRVVDPNRLSIYSRIFDEYNDNWKKAPDYNQTFIKGQQNYANHLLQARGHVFLQEVYDMLGFERTKEAQIVGWVKGEGGGDNYIDFGIYEERNINFINGHERSILLDFNVDGVIYDKI